MIDGSFRATNRSKVFTRIDSERFRQDSRWGVQETSFGRDLLVLVEEVGEAVKVYNEAMEAEGMGVGETYLEFEEELVQVAAVAVRILEGLV